MKIFASDLDNTLIYSYKRSLPSPNTCVEIYKNREISFMTHKSLELLESIEGNVCFVPTTTRSIEQYKRINFGENINPQYALVCNGGVLLHNGEIDEKWYNDSMDIIAESRPTLERAVYILEKDTARSFEIRKISELFVFTKSDDAARSLEILRKELDMSLVDVFNNGAKVYVVPKLLNKGMAVLRLKEKLMAKEIISAGDSEFDISMLKVVDYAYFCGDIEEYSYSCENAVAMAYENNVFSDKILEDIYNRHCIV